MHIIVLWTRLAVFHVLMFTNTQKNFNGPVPDVFPRVLTCYFRNLGGGGNISD